jgi:organic hydroperoxide reductase OsmC/OhrA
MAMPGMSQDATTGNPALTLVLALFMLGYVLWAIDRLAGLSRTMAAATAQGALTSRSSPATVTMSAADRAPVRAGPGATAFPRTALAPRLAACYKIAMAITMGYMLITML